ncbi:hypothetical protein [Marinobacter sp. X15-166B]|uniref:hypothetical protein n=1 Tax=Marinobacter sp. X15-166B TaxID=1897620 RepID=UPI00085BC1CE|nr:hypothetical protein [Marinobacter sp. X15-166B]OEY66410.1 hypothetical protein BG841_08025 [Marinobacter sp. X15-166B]
MDPSPHPVPVRHPWRKPLLIIEFTALAVLVGSMALLGKMNVGDPPLNPVWLLIPALASLVVFTSFIGLMYLRWVVAARAEALWRHKLIFALLALTLLSVWLYGVANTWLAINAG